MDPLEVGGGACLNVAQNAHVGDDCAGSASLLTNSPKDKSTSTEAIFDTGATGTIITNASILHNIQTCTPTNFKGIHGSMRVTKAGQLLDIGIVRMMRRRGSLIQ